MTIDAVAGVVMLSRQLATRRQKACVMVDKVVLSPLLRGILMGLLGPVALSGLFRIIVWLTTRVPAVSGPSADV